MALLVNAKPSQSLGGFLSIVQDPVIQSDTQLITSKEARIWRDRFAPGTTKYDELSRAITLAGRGVFQLSDGMKVNVVEGRLCGGSSFSDLMHIIAGTAISVFNSSHPAAIVIQGAVGLCALINGTQDGSVNLQIDMQAFVSSLSGAIRQEFNRDKLNQCQANFAIAVDKIKVYGGLREKNPELALDELKVARQKIDEAYHHLKVIFADSKYSAYQVFAPIALLRIQIANEMSSLDSAYAKIIPETINQTIEFLEEARNEWKDFRKLVMHQNGQICSDSDCLVDSTDYKKMLARLRSECPVIGNTIGATIFYQETISERISPDRTKDLFSFKAHYTAGINNEYRDRHGSQVMNDRVKYEYSNRDLGRAISRHHNLLGRIMHYSTVPSENIRYINFEAIRDKINEERQASPELDATLVQFRTLQKEIK